MCYINSKRWHFVVAIGRRIMFSLIVGANWEAIIGGIMGGLFGLMFFGALVGFAMDCGRVADENQNKREQKEKEEAELRALAREKLQTKKVEL